MGDTNTLNLIICLIQMMDRVGKFLSNMDLRRYQCIFPFYLLRDLRRAKLCKTLNLITVEPVLSGTVLSGYPL